MPRTRSSSSCASSDTGVEHLMPAFTSACSNSLAGVSLPVLFFSDGTWQEYMAPEIVQVKNHRDASELLARAAGAPSARARNCPINADPLTANTR